MRGSQGGHVEEEGAGRRGSINVWQAGGIATHSLQHRCGVPRVTRDIEAAFLVISPRRTVLNFELPRELRKARRRKGARRRRKAVSRLARVLLMRVAEVSLHIFDEKRGGKFRKSCGTPAACVGHVTLSSPCDHPTK